MVCSGRKNKSKAKNKVKSSDPSNLINLTESLNPIEIQIKSLQCNVKDETNPLKSNETNISEQKKDSNFSENKEEEEKLSPFKKNPIENLKIPKNNFETNPQAQKIIKDNYYNLIEKIKVIVSEEDMNDHSFQNIDSNPQTLIEALQRKIHSTFAEILSFSSKDLPSSKDLIENFNIKYMNTQNVDSKIFDDFKETLEEIERTKSTNLQHLNNKLKEKHEELKSIKISQEDNQARKYHNPQNSHKFIDKNSISAFKGSKGLRNLGNSCYMNSVLQLFAHFDEFDNFEFSSLLNSRLCELVKAMRKGQKNSSQLDNALSAFYKTLLDENDNFIKGQENDPKYLLIYLHKTLIDEHDLNLIRCTKSIVFKHKYNKKKYHKVAYPEQVTNVFSITPLQNSIQLSDIYNIINQFLIGDDNKINVKGYCEKCLKDVSGNEVVESCSLGNYAVFCMTNSYYNCYLNDIKDFSVGNYLFELVAVIIREVYQGFSAHNYAICKEGEDWIIYNDSEVKILDIRSLKNVYMLIYKTNKTAARLDRIV